MILIKKITAEATYKIRLEVLRKDIDLPCQFQGDLEAETLHAGVFLTDDLIGVSSFMKSSNVLFTDKNQYQLRGMAILPETRGKGYGKQLIDFAVQHLQHKNATILWCKARELAVNFYKKAGFSIVGDPFVVSEIGIHYLMYKKM
ncbi:MAG: GNAT family N-acetyltransferase [Polaribacter sp.]|nr:GNAT family N-acetyltransferase [Polaribacter sp.]